MRRTKNNARFVLASTLALGSVLVLASPGSAEIDVAGGTVEVIDMHLHTGLFENLAPTGRAHLIEQMPPFIRPYAPAFFAAQLEPFGEHVGIHEQTLMGGVDHAVIFATYTHHSTGFFTNEALHALLAGDQNMADDTPWSWGMASINFDGYLEPGVADARLAALASYFAERPDLFVGIKLAHAHQRVAFDDERYLDVYDVAAEHGVPALLHTGFSPFPGTEDAPEFYDPAALESVIEAYDGEHGMGRVDFVLSHVGGGDARSVEASLRLAETHDNVWLELSALKGPLRLGEDGEPVESETPQYEHVLASILERGLTGRALFASDGPQFSGSLRAYVEKLTETMVEGGYTLEQIRAVMGGNFRSLYLTSD